MVFARLSTQEKDAFFGLLDEYFQSRPELWGQGGEHQGAGGVAGTGVSTAAAASVVQRALAANAMGGDGASSKSNNPYAASMSVNEADITRAMSGAGRVAAASLAFSGGGPLSQSQPSQSQAPPAPTLPRRAASNAPMSASIGDRMGLPGSEVDKLLTKKTSVFSSFKKPESTGVPIPSAFAPPKNAFGPPPVRHAISETSTASTASTGNGGAGAAKRSLPPRQMAPEPELEPETQQGDWAEVLYDYRSEDSGDLAIEAGSRVFVTDKTSDDWWTGQVEGREGLFPASYVKLL